MAIGEYLTVGEQVELRVGAIAARTRVERLESDSVFAITHPTHQLIPLLFDPDELVLFFFFRENGMYSFHAKYTGRGNLDNIAVCYFEATSDIQKNQRRFSFRLPVVLNVTVRKKSQTDQSKASEYAAKTINLSQEGILIACYEKFELGARVLMDISLSESEVCILNGDILRCEPPLHKDDPYHSAARFVNMIKQDQSQLAKFILERQVQDRRRRQGLPIP